MSMELLEKVRKILDGAKNYSIGKELRKIGVEITTQGIDGYEKPSARSMRLDVLSALRELTGRDWNSFGKWIDEEFGKGSKFRKK